MNTNSKEINPDDTLGRAICSEKNYKSLKSRLAKGGMPHSRIWGPPLELKFSVDRLDIDSYDKAAAIADANCKKNRANPKASSSSRFYCWLAFFAGDVEQNGWTVVASPSLGEPANPFHADICFPEGVDASSEGFEQLWRKLRAELSEQIAPSAHLLDRHGRRDEH